MQDFFDSLINEIGVPLLGVLAMLFIFSLIIIFVRTIFSALAKTKRARSSSRQDNTSTNIEKQDQKIPETQEEALAAALQNSKYFHERCVLNDIYLLKAKGGYTQTDIIAVNKRGIYVIECKDYSGWIYGTGNQRQWTETVGYNRDARKFRFYNPIFQNNTHIAAIKHTLPASLRDKIVFHSIIVFGDRAELKNISYFPKNTYIIRQNKLENLLADINSKPEILTAEEVVSIIKIINKHKIEPTEEIREFHTDTIRQMTGEKRIYQ